MKCNEGEDDGLCQGQQTANAQTGVDHHIIQSAKIGK